MGVVHTLLLWFIPLALIPLILHLLTLRRLKTVELSTFRFLFDSFVSQRRRLKFQEALLTALRTLFVLFLVFLFARPVVKRWSALFRGGGSDRYVLVDCSASMNARTAGVSALDRAKAGVLSLVRGLSADDRVTLIRVAARPEEVFSRFRPDLDALRRKLDTLEPSPSGANVLAALTYVFEAIRGSGSGTTLYLFTDGQASGWREARAQGLDPLIPQGTRLVVVNVGSQEPVPNLAVVGEPPNLAQVVAGLPVIVKARVVNASGEERPDVTVSVSLDNQEVGRCTLNLKPGETGAGELVYIPRDPGLLRGRMEVPVDRFPDDNAYLFTLRVLPQIKVLLVNGRPDADPFANETLYLRTALTAGATAGGDEKTAALLPGKDFVRSLDVQETPESVLRQDLLKGASVVILANCGQLVAAHCDLLRDYVASGGGLIVFPGEQVNPAVYNTIFLPVPGPQREYLVPALLESPVGTPGQADTFERLGALDYGHPVLSVFDDPQARYLATVLFYRRFPIRPLREYGAVWALAEFSAGTPALVESRLGRGTVLLAAFPASARWSNLPLKPEFVPLVLRMVSHVQRRPELDAPSVAVAEGAAEIAVAAGWAAASGTVVNAAGLATPLEFKRAGPRLVATFDRARQKGYYDVVVRGGSAAERKQAEAVIAVNVPSEESEPQVLRRGDLAAMMPRAKWSLVDASAEAQQLYGGIGDEREIWRPLIFLLFAMMGLEFALATWQDRQRERRRGRLAQWLNRTADAWRPDALAARLLPSPLRRGLDRLRRRAAPDGVRITWKAQP
jgi:hypothetical protein